MRHAILFLTGVLCFAAAGCSHTPEPISILPAPTSVAPASGRFDFTASTTFVVENREQAAVAEGFARLFTLPAGFTPRVVESGAADSEATEGDIRFVSDTTMAPEAYVLEIRPERITLQAADRRGFFYALQSCGSYCPRNSRGNRRPMCRGASRPHGSRMPRGLPTGG